MAVFFFSSRRRHTRFDCDWSSDVCSSDLRETLVPMQGTRLPDDLLSLGGMAMQLLYWESTSGHCPRCGTPTERMPGEWGKRCPTCRYEHYPHLHPAVIVLVRDGDRVLLPRKAIWPPGRYALVAGF